MDKYTIISIIALVTLMISLGMYIGYLFGKRKGAREYYDLLTKNNQENQIQ